MNLTRDTHTPATTPSTEEFVRLLMATEEDLFTYAYSLLRNAEDVREVLQEAAVTTWQHFHEFDTSRPFFPWASKFVYFAVLNFRKRKYSAQHLFSDPTLRALATDYETHHEEFDARSEALSQCVEKLPAPARTLLRHRYHQNHTVPEIARKTNRKINTLYKAFDRIRNWLLECLQRTLAAEARP